MILSREEALILLRQGALAPSAGSWPCKVGPMTVRFASFEWRRRALHAHDLHHLMTGYPMTMRGEFQMAAWEWGAGRYPHWGATLFCAPLVIAGLVWSPRRIWNAWRKGRQSQSLYGALPGGPGRG